jgi:hypothetical protein
MSQNEYSGTAASSKMPAITRREFALRAAIASAATTLSPAILVSVAAASPDTETPFAFLQDFPDKPNPSPEGMIELEARSQLVFARYGKRLSDEQKVDIRRLQRLLQPQLESLRAFSLSNGDSPALYLKPLLEREQPPAAKPALPAKR